MENYNGPREACGVFGVFGVNEEQAATVTHFGLFALQHRGQESAGIVVNSNGKLHGHTGMGLAGEVFTPEILKNLNYEFKMWNNWFNKYRKINTF